MMLRDDLSYSKLEWSTQLAKFVRPALRSSLLHNLLLELEHFLLNLLWIMYS